VTTGAVLTGTNPLRGPQMGPYQLPDPTHRYALVIRSYGLATQAYSFTPQTNR
jgi:hypothetical protein